MAFDGYAAAGHDARMSATTLTTAGLEQLATGVRSAIATHADWSRTAQLVADQLHFPLAQS